MNSLNPVDLVAGALCVAGLLFIWWRRVAAPPRKLASTPCPECREIYGADIGVNIVPVHYRWTLARGHSRATLGLPRTTHLVTCPRCLAEFEFKQDGSLFEHPQQGILSCVRTGRSRSFHGPVRRGRVRAMA